MDGKLFFIGLILAILVLAWVGAGVLWRAAEMAEIVAPIDEVAYEGLTVVTIGTGSANENPERHGPSTVIGFRNSSVLIDAGRGVTHQEVAAPGTRTAGGGGRPVQA